MQCIYQCVSTKSHRRSCQFCYLSFIYILMIMQLLSLSSCALDGGAPKQKKMFGFFLGGFFPSVAECGDNAPGSET